MASAETLTIAAPSMNHPMWENRADFASEFAELCLDSYLSHYLFRIGIYGWRKRCLYFLVIVVSSLVIVNLSLTVWIIKVLDFSRDGMGHLRINKNGIRLEGEASFLQTIYAAEIHSRQSRSLKVESSRNITISTRNIQGRVTNRLHIGEGKMEVFTDHFSIRGPSGQLLLDVTDREVVMAAQKMTVSGRGGVTFDGSVQTPLVTADPMQELRLESPTRRLSVNAPEGIGIESKAGDIIASCMDDFRLHSREGAVVFDSERLILRNLRTVMPTKRGRSYPGIYEMCSCGNGKLFLSPPDGKCRASDNICK